MSQNPKNEEIEQESRKPEDEFGKYDTDNCIDDERLRFEMLLSEMSATFINIPYDHIDSEIESGLKKIVEFFCFDRGSLFQQCEDGMRLTHSWAVDNFKAMKSYIAEEEIPWATSVLLKNKDIFKFNSIDDLPVEAVKEREFFKKYGPVSVVAVPLLAGGEVIGTAAFGNLQTKQPLPDDLVERIRLVGMIFANALMRKKAEESLQKAFFEINSLKDQLKLECGYLREEIDLKFKHGEIIGQSDAIRKVLIQIEKVATTDSTVLLFGETGTGKELLARAIHNSSNRKDRAMVKVNCTTLPSTLVESELFGREKGAYTGAMTRQIGRFEVADGSTIFLDEIGELPAELQPKLLRVLQDGQFERLGSPKSIKVNVRVIAATNQDLAKAVRMKNFREDLYFRLNVFPITVPPLRMRQDDIPLLVWAFVREFEGLMGKTIEHIPNLSIDAMQRYTWPGNVRELRNVVERAMILNRGSTLVLNAPEVDLLNMEPLTLEEMEKSHILKVLQRTGGRVRGKHGAADILGLKPTTLDSKIKKLGIPRRP